MVGVFNNLSLFETVGETHGDEVEVVDDEIEDKEEMEEDETVDCKIKGSLIHTEIVVVRN